MRLTNAAIKSITEKEDRKVLLEIEVPSTVVEQEADRVYRKLVHQINIPGFRRGKVPRPIIEQRLGRDVFYEEVQRDLLNDAFVEAISTTDIRPLSTDIVEVNLTPGSPLVFQVEVLQEPRVTVENYKELPIQIPQMEVTEEQVDAALKELQQRYSKMVLVKDRPAETGDLVLLDFDGIDENGEAVEKVTEKNFRVEIGTGQTIPGFEDGIIGMQLNEEKNVPCTFPDDYKEESLQGKLVTFRMKLKELKQRVLPELNDEFAQELGDEHPTLAELRAHLRSTLEKNMEDRQRDMIKSKTIDRLIDDHEDVSVPDEMVEHHMDRIQRNLEQELRMYRLDLDGLLSRQGKTLEEFREDSRPRAERLARADILLHSIADGEKITATEEEIDAKLKEWADSLGQDIEKLREKMLAEGSIRIIRDEIILDKVKDLLADGAKIEYVEATEEDVEGESEE